MRSHRSWMLCLMLICLAGGSASTTASPCAAPPQVWGGFAELTQTWRPLQHERALTIVALGSSSTEGIGASTPERSYPAQLERLLRQRFANARIRVINRGVGGETAANLARLDRDVLSVTPELVIWQVGTNDALLGVEPDRLRETVLAGISTIRAAGADIVLLDPQPLAEGERESAVQRVRGVLADAAQATGVPLLSRHQLMRFWLDSGQMEPAMVLGPDGLHMTDTSYLCLAERIADLFPEPAQSATAGAS